MIKLTKHLKTLSTAILGLTTLAISTYACSTSENKLLVSSTLGELFKQLLNSDSNIQRTVELNNRLRFIATLEGTSKGNGTLRVHNLNLRLFDQHDDGAVYEGDLLNIDFKDLNNDNFNELIVTGIIKYTSDDEIKAARYESFTQIFSYDCSIGVFKSIYKAGSYSIDLPVSDVKVVKCTND